MAPIFDFKALTKDGKSQKGMIESDTVKNARLKLKKQNLMVTEIEERTMAQQASKAAQIPFFGGRVSSRDIAMMTRQLASLIKANITIVEALTAMVDQIDRPTLKFVLSSVRDDVNEGLTLSKAMAKHPKVFDNIFVNMVDAGENSGTLSLVLLRLADLKETQMRLRNKIVSGMTYPALMMFVSFVLTILIFTFIIPQLVKVFDSLNKPMPAMTKFMLWISDFLVSYWYALIAAALVGIYLFRKSITSAAGAPKWDGFKLRLPVIGTLIRMIAVTRFSTTMATLLSSGVPILAAMNIAKNLVGNIPIAKAITNARENITEGQSIAEPLKRSGEFPPMVIHMISIGEKTGELPDMLKSIAETYEEQVSAKIDGLTALLEPAMIIGMGLVVGFVVFSIFVPLLDISSIQGNGK